MGLFLAASCVAGHFSSNAFDALRETADLTPLESGEDEDGGAAIDGKAGSTLMYPPGFLGWDGASAALASKLRCPVLSVHIHDGDFWMYRLFSGDKELTAFNSIPEYWGELDDVGIQSWSGNAAELADCIPGLRGSDVSKYLVGWDDLLDQTERSKAYPDDVYYYCDEWQLTDFLRRLGFSWPLPVPENALVQRFELREM